MTAARPDTWMPFYWGDYLRDTGHLSAAEHGAYMLMIGHYWTTGRPLPDDDGKLRRIARMTRAEWRSSGETLLDFFVRDGDCLRHARIDKELLRSEQIVEKRAAAGRASAQQRANNAHSKNPTHVEHMREQTDQQTDQQTGRPSQSQLQEKKSQAELGQKKRGTRLPEGFDPDRNFASKGLSAAQVEAEVAKFRDFWRAKPGQAGVKLDWDATWRNWCRNSRFWTASAGNSVDPVAAEARIAVQKWLDTGQWTPHPDAKLGDHPGLPGCRVPQEILAEYGERIARRAPGGDGGAVKSSLGPKSGASDAQYRSRGPAEGADPAIAPSDALFGPSGEISV